jgi:hypothetical protein
MASSLPRCRTRTHRPCARWSACSPDYAPRTGTSGGTSPSVTSARASPSRPTSRCGRCWIARNSSLESEDSTSLSSERESKSRSNVRSTRGGAGPRVALSRGVRQEEDVRLVHGVPRRSRHPLRRLPLPRPQRRRQESRTRRSAQRTLLRVRPHRRRTRPRRSEADGSSWRTYPDFSPLNGGRDFGIVLQTLADLGFAVAYRVLDSRYFGVPQRRRRVFIVGHPRADYARAVLFERERRRGSAEPSEAAEAEVAGTLGGGSGSRGWCDDFDRGGHTSLSGLGSGGADDNDAQAGRLIVAAPLTSGTPPNSKQAGRRQDDDVNLVAFHTTQRSDPPRPHTRLL